ncbi:MAG: radical SAM protein, partial [Bacteroidota bacterium]
MSSNSVVFIAFEDRENLGVRYMAAVLSENGYEAHIIDFRKERSEIMDELISLDPFLLGFSIIFEEHIYNFRDLITSLRESGFHNHFTAGGHYASLEQDALFETIPGLDSIVRFEGEHTMLDLSRNIHSGADWRTIKGISYVNNGTIVNNELRSLEKDLDTYPYPIRSAFSEYVLEKKHTTIIAGRGCIHNCVYCNIGEFYRLPPGPVKRIRNPVRVVEEMDHLYREHDCSVFLFQDDDFPFTTSGKSAWIHDFCEALRDKGLVRKIMWKVNCRPDEVERGIIEMMKECGLFRIYLGIEDGTDTGLLRINKKQKVTDSLRGVEIIKDLGIGMDFGFMLFQPTTTYKTLKKNLMFLETICGDGYMPVAFLKMLPYFGTRIEKDLRDEGRLTGLPGFLDYDFYEKSLNDYHHLVFDLFNQWLNAPEGFTNMSKWTRDYLSMFSFYFGSMSQIQQLSDELQSYVSVANLFMLDTLRRLSAKFESGDYQQENDMEIDEIRDAINEQHSSSMKSILEIIRKVELYSLTK